MATLSFAAVASAAPAGGGVQAATTKPDVTSAAITEQPAITAAGTPKIKVCFDSQIANPVAANFAVSGTDVAGNGNPLPVPAAGAAPIPAELSCVSLTYPAGTNLAGFSTLEVQAGAVTPAGGAAGSNPQGAVALTGGDVAPSPGRTAGPNLTGATSVPDAPGGSEVTFTFDKLIAQSGGGAPVFARFGYYTAAGAPVVAGALVVGGVGDRSVKVKFATTVAAGARVFALNDAVTLAGQPDQGNTATATSGAGGAAPATAAPDLASVARVPSLQGTFDLTYDSNVTATGISAPLCFADTPTGRFAGSAVSVINPTTVRVTFGVLASSSGSDLEVVKVGDVGGCAADNGLTVLSSVGAVPIQNKDHTAGFTSGPDLTGCSAPAGSTDVTYTFDEQLDPGAVAPGGLSLIDADGAKVPAATFLQVAANTATVRFATAGVLGAAAACSVDRGAVTDRQPAAVEPSSMNTVKVNSVGTPENAGPPPPPPPAPPPGPPKVFPKQPARSLGISTVCHRATRGRVRCTTRGTLKLATSLLPFGKPLICVGKIRIRYTTGSRTRSSRTTNLRRTCTYKATKTFRVPTRQRSRLRVQSRYLGSPVSLPKSSRKIRARVRR